MRRVLVAALPLGVVAALSAAYLRDDARWLLLVVYLWFGLAYGALLQYGRFCMASAVRDLFAVGVPRMAVGVLIAVVLFGAAGAVTVALGLNPIQAHPMGWHVLIGGAVFGLGMVLAGGCASSSLYKTGEGNLGSVLVLLSISFSQAWFVDAEGWLQYATPAAWQAAAGDAGLPESLTPTRGWFDAYTVGYLWPLQGHTVSQALGWPAGVTSALLNYVAVALLPALLLLVLLYGRTFRARYRRAQPSARGLAGEWRGLWQLLRQSSVTAWAGLGLGLVAGLQLWVIATLKAEGGFDNFGEVLSSLGHEQGLSLQGTVFDPGYWYITTQEAQWGGWLLALAGREMHDNLFFGLENGLPAPWHNPPGMMSVGIILGAAAMASLRGEFKWRWPSAETAALAIAGGALMGLGARLGLGCNVGAFFAAVTHGDASGWVFLLGMTLGGFVAVRGLQRWIRWRAARLGLAV